MTASRSTALFTVTAHFGDHRIGISQYEAESPFAALSAFVRGAESLEGYDRGILLASLSEAQLIHIGSGLLGFWSWHPAPSDVDDSPMDVLGGHIIQTDPEGPKRLSARE